MISPQGAAKFHITNVAGGMNVDHVGFYSYDHSFDIGFIDVYPKRFVVEFCDDGKLIWHKYDGSNWTTWGHLESIS